MRTIGTVSGFLGVLLLLTGCPGDDSGNPEMMQPDVGGSDSTGGAGLPPLGSDDGDPPLPDPSTTSGDPFPPPAGTDTGEPGSDTGEPPPSDTGEPPPPEVPAGWTCDPSYYGAADGCDCGCGELDPDCIDATAAACEYCDGCGANSGDCSTVVEADDNTVCIPGDCGNGTVEGGELCDGAAPMGAACEDLGFTGGTLACSGSCNADLSACTGGPAGWTCFPDFYGAADGCDCGCGVVDPDCADATTASCDYCGDVGTCGALGADCTVLDPMNNAVCL